MWGLQSTTVRGTPRPKSHRSGWKLWPLTQTLWFDRSFVHRQCQSAKQITSQFILLCCQVDLFTLAFAGVKGGDRERDLLRWFASFWIQPDWAQFQQSIPSFKWTVLQRAHLKLANQGDTFPWPVSHIPHECHSDITKVKDAPLEYDRTDSGEAYLKCVVATCVLSAPHHSSFEVQDNLSIYFWGTRWLSTFENPTAML